jgi:hypothetical protein
MLPSECKRQKRQVPNKQGMGKKMKISQIIDVDRLLTVILVNYFMWARTWPRWSLHAGPEIKGLQRMVQNVRSETRKYILYTVEH